MLSDLNRLYSLLDELETLPHQGRKLSEYTGRSPWPTRGVYFFREPGEHRAGLPSKPRVVRVGTHAVSTNSKSTLWQRLRAHRGGLHGGGNHRGSIFRRHIGAALLARDGGAQAEGSWGVGSSASRAIRALEADHEERVSAYLGRMTVLWVEVPDASGPTSDRAVIERNAIALLSNGLHPVDPPSVAWLGRYSTKEPIRRSGLWNLDHVVCSYDPAFLALLSGYANRM
jgi:hypothetical protein